MSDKKDNILTRIVQLQQKNAELELEHNSLGELKKQTTKRRDDTQSAYLEIQRQLKQIEDKLAQVQADWTSVGRIKAHNTSEIEALKRELSRIEDAERINAEYLQQVESFKEACLTAPWRLENRSDRRGAKPYQIDGAIHLAVAKQAVLADKRGLGKTLTSLIWADLMGAQKVIAVTPPDTMQNYAREVRLWTPHRTPIIIGRAGRVERDILIQTLNMLPEFVAIINYEAWRKDADLIDSLVKLNADTLICDEAHRMKEMNTLTNNGVMSLRFGLNDCPSCLDPKIKAVDAKADSYRCENCGHAGFILEFCSIKNVIPMTGTPILNSPQEIFPLLRLVDPHNFKSLNVFLRDFCVQTAQNRWRWQYGAEKELMEIIGPRFLGRDRNSVGVDIPEAQFIFHEISLQDLQEDYPKQYKAYMQTRDYAQLVLDPDNEVTMSMTIKAVVLLRLRQVLTWPAAIELKIKEEVGRDLDDEPIYQERVLANLDVHESAKVDKAEELIRELIKEGERVVLFSQFKGPLRELQKRLGSCSVVYDGETSSSVRNAIQLDFDPKTVTQTPRWSVVLCNYKAAGEGLNFNAASQMVILDREWNPGRESQAIGRIDRLGQTKPAQIHFIEVGQSVDTWLRNLIAEKADMIAGFEENADAFRSAFEALKKGEM